MADPNPRDSAVALLTIVASDDNAEHIGELVTATLEQDIIDCGSHDVALSHMAITAAELSLLAAAILRSLADVTGNTPADVLAGLIAATDTT